MTGVASHDSTTMAGQWQHGQGRREGVPVVSLGSAVLVLGRAGHSHRKGEPQRMRMSPEDDVGP